MGMGKLMRATFAASAIAALGSGCGSDVQTTLHQIDNEPFEGEFDYPGLETDVACASSAECEDGDRCTEDRCVEGECVAFAIPSTDCCSADVLFSESFDGTIDDGVAMSQLNGAAGWHILPARATSEPYGLYFGDPTTMSYNVGEHVAGEVVLPAVDLPLDRISVLTMRLFAGIETSWEFDLFWVKADVIEGGAVAETVDLLDKRGIPANAYEAFALVELDLEPMRGRRIVIRFGFDSIDEVNNDFEGVWLDDLQVLATCPVPGVCSQDSDCDDHDECTINICAPAGCLETFSCDTPDPDPTVDETNPCLADDAPDDCCISDADCDDGDSATINTCNGATCETTLNPDACDEAVECDDGESCTTDSCNNNFCRYVGDGSAACCTESLETLADFDNESLQGIYVTDNFETGVFWTTDKTRSSGGEFSLYCGDPVTQTLASTERVKTSATTRPIDVPVGGTTTIAFDLYKATRFAKNYDVFQAFILRDGALLPAWSSKLLPNGTTDSAWRHVRVPLTFHAGQRVQVRFVFDSVDAPTQGHEGVYIDSLRVETVCDE